MTQWDASSQPPDQPATNAFAPIQNGSAAMPHGSPTSSISSSSTGFPQSFDFSSASPGPSRADLAAQLPKLEQPSYEPSSGPTGSTPMSFASLGLAFPSRPSTAGGNHSLDGVGAGFGTSLGFMFPSWDLGDDVDFGAPPGEQAHGNGASTAGLDWGLLNMPECRSCRYAAQASNADAYPPRSELAKRRSHAFRIDCDSSGMSPRAISISVHAVPSISIVSRVDFAERVIYHLE